MSDTKLSNDCNNIMDCNNDANGIGLTLNSATGDGNNDDRSEEYDDLEMISSFLKAMMKKMKNLICSNIR